MPYIELVTNKKVEKATENSLNREFGRIIELMPGKSEQWLMIHIEDEAKLCLGGSTDSAAIVSLSAFGREQTAECYDSLTAAITESCSRLLDVAGERIYVRYSTTAHWGWSGRNFILKPDKMV